MEDYSFASEIDLNMGYYHIKLDADSQKLCTIVFTWGKHKCKRLRIGIKISWFPDIFLNVIFKHVQGMEYFKTFMLS
jgi:hypothetical protein